MMRVELEERNEKERSERRIERNWRRKKILRKAQEGGGQELDGNVEKEQEDVKLNTVH